METELDIVLTIDFTVALIDGECIESKGRVSGRSYQDFFWGMLRDGWMIKNEEGGCRFISPYQIKEIVLKRVVWD